MCDKSYHFEIVNLPNCFMGGTAYIVEEDGGEVNILKTPPADSVLIKMLFYNSL